jgi:hypothetical protein
MVTLALAAVTEALAVPRRTAGKNTSKQRAARQRKPTTTAPMITQIHVDDRRFGGVETGAGVGL